MRCNGGVDGCEEAEYALRNAEKQESIQESMVQWPAMAATHRRKPTKKDVFFILCYRSGHGAVFSSCDIQHCFGVSPVLIEAQDISGILRQPGSL
jgi:hypothetical protein